MVNNSRLNDFATRSFRDTADMDYISARMSYRVGLIEQFHWQALQALEKYFKAIFLYNRIEAKKIGHNLSKAVAKTHLLPFNLELTAPALDFIDHLDKFARFRYLESSYYIYGPKLLELDRTVWEIRRYCQVINYDLKLGGNTVKNMLAFELDAIEKSKNIPFHKFKIIGGALEKIIDKKNHSARKPLIWQNAFFGIKQRKTVSMPNSLQGKNSPLSLYPEMLNDLLKYVYLPKIVIDEYSN